jgi:hypothetical protein
MALIGCILDQIFGKSDAFIPNRKRELLRREGTFFYLNGWPNHSRDSAQFQTPNTRKKFWPWPQSGLENGAATDKMESEYE